MTAPEFGRGSPTTEDTGEGAVPVPRVPASRRGETEAAGFDVLVAGPLTTVQDQGRPGYAAMGVPRSGAADQPSLELANRLVGNPASAAALELTFGGLAVRFRQAGLVALTGASCPMWLDGRPVGIHCAVPVLAGQVLRVGAPIAGLRAYLAVRGGVAVEPVLGSRSTDLLSGLGPPPLSTGQVLPVGSAGGSWPADVVAPVRWLPSPADLVVLRVRLGPRDDWFPPEALTRLAHEEFRVTGESDRVGMRLAGPELRRSDGRELPSEGMVAGAVQVPPGGHPVLFLADHPVTGGYPVVAVVVSEDVPLAAQCVPGQRVRFRPVR
ncbi:biotin-dependent carboxyltransferase family protein [Actinoalloteichus caeruleus]|uniref:5-oxoprolinase subunit C family protein n=1 Tax=Actinoalloteichus cyanogriseus TaxID=2893586 RepID=UPI003AAE7CBA